MHGKCTQSIYSISTTATRAFLYTWVATHGAFLKSESHHKVWACANPSGCRRFGQPTVLWSSRYDLPNESLLSPMSQMISICRTWTKYGVQKRAFNRFDGWRTKNGWEGAFFHHFAELQMKLCTPLKITHQSATFHVLRIQYPPTLQLACCTTRALAG